MIIVLGVAAYSIIGNPITTETTVQSTTYSFPKPTLSSEKSTKISSEEKAGDKLPNAKPTDWNLALVGPHNKLEKEVPESQLAVINDSYQVDNRIVEDYNAFAEAAKKAGFPLVLISAYRSIAYQQQVFDESVNQLRNSGLSEEEANEKAKETHTEPGYSEHHLGLALDVVDENWNNSYPNQVLDAAYGSEPGAKWIAKNAAEYGFIIRYPDGEENITGITYEPWHIRYVGKENAQYIKKHNLTLEEYVELLEEK